MDRSDGAVAAAQAPPAAAPVARRESSSATSNGGASTRSASSSRHASVSGSTTSSSANLSRRNSSNDRDTRESSSSRDYHRDTSRESRHSSRDGRDRDPRPSSQRSRSPRESSRDRRSDRDRDRDRSSGSGGGGASSSSSHHHHGASNHFGASGNPVVRLRERNNLLVMHRTATRRSNLSPSEIALRVYGLDAQYVKDQENPNISDKLGLPGVYPTNMNHPEEKFRVHAVRGVAFVNEPPRGFGNNWHLQYSFFTDKKYPVFDEVARAASTIERIDKTRAGEIVPAVPSQTDPPFAAYLIRNVRRIDERISNQWMSELASGKKTIPELVQSYGVPFKQWRPVPNMSKCPLLDFVVRFRPGFAEATWFIRINVIYVELNEIKRDCNIRHGDWFHNPRRFQRHALGWTEQLVDFLHSLARQGMKGGKKPVEVNESKASGAKPISALDQLAASTLVTSVKNHLHSDAGMDRDVPSSQSTSQAASQVPAQPSVREKWSYVLKLSEYQYKIGLLHRARYFDGLLSLLQKALTPRGRSGNRPSLLLLGVNEIMELIGVIQSLLPELLLNSDGGLLLVKTLLQHLRYLLPPGAKVSNGELPNQLQHELVVAICQMLRGIILNNHDLLVRLEDNGPHSWPSYVFSSRFFNRSVYGEREIDACLSRCRQLAAEVSGRIARVQPLCSTSFTLASTRNEVQVILALDRFHRVDATVDVSRLYHEVFAPLSSIDVGDEIPVDAAAVFLVCEWAISVHRPAEYRYLSALSLLEMHNKVLLEFARENNMLVSRPNDHHVVLQGALQSFLRQYQLKAISEATQLIELFCLLVRRRLFSVESFVDFAANAIEASAHEAPPPTPLMSPSSYRSSSSQPVTSATVVSTAYNIECAPGRGYKASEIALLTTAERLRLYLWQLPRGPFPLPTCLPMIPETAYDSELSLLRWLEVMDLRQEHLSYSKTLERAQTLCVYVFHTHGEVNDPNEPSNKDRVMKEIEYQGKVSDLVSAVKTMCGHDKGRFTLWFLKNIYEEASFFKFSELGSVEQIVRLVCLVLEIVDILALLEVVIYFLRQSPAFVVKNVVIAMIERHEVAFCVTEQIPLLIQTFIDRFKGLEKLADDKPGNIARFFCRMFNAHSKKIGTPDLPFALIRAIAEVARKNNQEANQKPKELSLEATNLPPVRIPTARETIPPEVRSALSRSFKALQARSFSDGSDANPSAVSTPLASPDSQSSQTSATEPSYEAPLLSALTWKDVVTEASDASESKARDGAIDFAVTAVNMSMASSMGATNANATRERRTPNYVFVLRAVLSEVMDKWMANITARTKTNNRRSMMTPQYVHRCVRFLREMVEQHPEGEDFQEKFSNTLLQWLQKEVIPAFAGTETQRRVRNPFIKIETENGKEAFLLNQRGRLEKLQYGLKAFIVSLVIHKVVDLSQVLRLALFPIFPRNRRASRDPAPNLPSQLLAMTLVHQLFSEPPPNVMLDQQRSLMFDEAMTKYHLRFLRSQVPAGLMFPLVHLLCQISYQMEDNTLRRRDERGNLASSALFNLTADPIVREIIFYDTKEAREKHVLPAFNKKQWQWHTAALMTHFFRPPNAPAEEGPNQVQLLKVDQIVDQMTVWGLNRGGSIYLDLQIARLQQKATGSNKAASRQSAKRKAASDLRSSASKKARSSQMNGSSEKSLSNHRDDEERSVGYLDAPSSEEEAVDIDIDTTGSPAEILASLIVVRTLRRNSRPPSIGNSTTLSLVSPISMPHLFVPHRSDIEDDIPSTMRQLGHEIVSAKQHLHPGEATAIEKALASGQYEAQEAAAASLYAAMICSISRRTMGSVIAKVLQTLEDDAKCMGSDGPTRLHINGSSVVRLISGVMCTHPGSAFLPRYMMSVATQLESLYEACVAFDEGNKSKVADTTALRRLRRKVAVRLQLVVVIGQGKHLTQTICYRNRIVKTLFYLLGTSTTNRGAGLSLFSWILDLIPYVRSSILHDKHAELVASLNLPPELERRVWTLFPRPLNGADAVFVRDTKAESLLQVDPWGLLEHAAPLPSDNVVPAVDIVQPKRRRVFGCV